MKANTVKFFKKKSFYLKQFFIKIYNILNELVSIQTISSHKRNKRNNHNILGLKLN